MTMVKLYLWFRVLLILIGLLVLYSWVPGDAGAATPYKTYGVASAYGPCCTWDAPGSGYIQYERPGPFKRPGPGPWHGLERWETSVASPWLPRGTHICLEIPPHPNSWGETIREYGYTLCDRPLAPEAVGDPLHPMRGELTISDHLPAYHGRQNDLSVGLLRDISFCDPEWTDYWCALMWGVPVIGNYVFG
jgi:hypothetical protein